MTADGIEYAAVFGGLLAYFVAMHMLWRRAESRRRTGRRYPRARRDELLTTQVHLPTKCGSGPYTERWAPDGDGLDDQLAQLHRELWPRQEWLRTLTCPTPDLTGYATHAAARAAHPRGRLIECACALVHVDRRRSRRPRRRSR